MVYRAMTILDDKPAAATLTTPDYDSIAAFYQKHWCSHYHSGLMAMADRYLLRNLPAGARLLDLCCGTGTLARSLLDRGYTVTGIDASAGMLRHAAAQAPEAEFLVADARQFHLPAMFDAALCTFDSISYFQQLEELENVFRNVCQALRPGASFVFDLSLEEAYKEEWRRSCSIVEDDEVCFIRGSYDEHNRTGQTLITLFSLQRTWERTDVSFTARCRTPDEVLQALKNAGFASCVCHKSNEDDELRENLGPGRACFVATRATCHDRH
jgi:SAM-dependent methyltransferase